MDAKAIRRAALVTLRRAICKRFPPGPERWAHLQWAAGLAKSSTPRQSHSLPGAQATSSEPIVMPSTGGGPHDASSNRIRESQRSGTGPERFGTGAGADALLLRPQLAAAVKEAKVARCPVIVSKPDRLSRNVHRQRPPPAVEGGVFIGASE
jgi:hypothetical protein